MRDRVRRLPNDTPMYREVKRLVREDNDTLGALKMLRDLGDLIDEHVEAHERWLDAQDKDPEDFA